MPNPKPLDAPSGEQKVSSADGNPGSFFGSAVAVSGDMALIGAKSENVDGRSIQGAVYVYRKTRGVWKQAQKLVASDGAAGDQFGSVITLLGKDVVITSPYASVEGRIWQGAAYVFSFSGNTWVEKQKLTAKGGGVFETFGRSARLGEKYLFVGSGGAQRAGQYKPYKVHVFLRKAGKAGDTWVEKQVLDAPDPDDPTSAFGGAIAIADGRAMIGAATSTIDGNPGQGAVYAYREVRGVWKLTDTLLAHDGVARDNFGIAVGFDGETALIGSPGVEFDSGVSQGAVYQFQLSKKGWVETQKFTSEDGTGINLFGASVSYSNDSVLVGAYAVDSYRGAAYMFRRKSGTWKQTRKLVAADGLPGDVFGYYTSLDKNTALVGAYGASVDGKAQLGAAYFFNLVGLGSAQGTAKEQAAPAHAIGALHHHSP
jgi:hypothetical protein